MEKPDKKRLRSFGLLVGGVFLGIGLWPLVHGLPYRVWAVVVAVVLLVPAVVWPRPLAPLFKGWMFIGLVLGWINTRIILGLIFYLMVTPIGLVMRLLGKDPMTRGFDPEAGTYRVKKEERSAKHMERQF
jgi:hypothetical protein